jgi:hypothetical protein
LSAKAFIYQDTKRIIKRNYSLESMVETTSTMGDFKVGVSVGVYCTKCTLNTGVNTNFEITHCKIVHLGILKEIIRISKNQIER